MTDTITAESILVAGGTYLPQSLLLQSESDSNGWAAVKDVRATFETTVQEAGWTFFFMAGEIKTTVFGFDKQKALRVALKRLIASLCPLTCIVCGLARPRRERLSHVHPVRWFQRWTRFADLQF